MNKRLAARLAARVAMARLGTPLRQRRAALDNPEFLEAVFDGISDIQAESRLSDEDEDGGGGLSGFLQRLLENLDEIIALIQLLLKVFGV